MFSYVIGGGREFLIVGIVALCTCAFLTGIWFFKEVIEACIEIAAPLMFLVLIILAIFLILFFLL